MTKFVILPMPTDTDTRGRSRGKNMDPWINPIFIDLDDMSAGGRGRGGTPDRDDFEEPGMSDETPPLPETGARVIKANVADGLKEAIRILKDDRSTDEDLLAAYYYQLGVLSERGFNTALSTKDALSKAKSVTRSCSERGACKDLGRDLDRLLDSLSRGRGRMEDVGDWLDKIRDCVNG